MNLTRDRKKLEQAFEAFKEKKLDERTREILHDLGIPQVMPTSNPNHSPTPFKSINSPIAAGDSI